MSTKTFHLKRLPAHAIAALTMAPLRGLIPAIAVRPATRRSPDPVTRLESTPWLLRIRLAPPT